MKSPYEVLGVAENATSDQIKKAYRRKAMNTHPDRDSGNHGEFQEVAKAYALLSDQSRREQYHKTGETQEKDQRAIILQELAGLMLTILDKVEDVSSIDVVGVMEQNIKNAISNHQEAIAQIGFKIQKRKSAILRFKRKKGKKDNILSMMLRGDIAKQEQVLDKQKEALKQGEEMLKVLSEYAYTFEAPPIQTQTAYFTVRAG